jgi:hypothetical protein
MSNLLHKDILGTGLNSLDENVDMPDLDGFVAKEISTHLRYAVLFWIFHLVHSLVEDDLLKSLDTFCHNHLLHWLGCLSYLKKTDIALSSLVTVTEFLEVCILLLGLECMAHHEHNARIHTCKRPFHGTVLYLERVQPCHPHIGRTH